jgi:alanine-synthesizing transaminase
VFSHRVPDDVSPNRISRARIAHPPRVDLTVSNPTQCGIAYQEGILLALSDPNGAVYAPHPRGLAGARTAVAAEYRRRGADVDPERIVLTASTSEAYAFLFKLLCDPGDGALVPTPSYPLFEHLARAEGVEAVPYHLDPETGWRLDPGELAAAPDNVRAVVVVHPNNPTGSFVRRADGAAVAELAAARGWGLIADEVFLDFSLGGGSADATSFATSAGPALTFTLGGLSKSVGLPQLKLGWIVAGGPERLVGDALARLDLIADTFLSVGTPVQLALPRLLREGASIRAAIRERCAANLAALRRLAAAYPTVSVLAPEAGWSAALRFPSVVSEEELVIELLEHDGVAVQPGYFFDFPVEGIVVVSLLPLPNLFAEGVAGLLGRIARHVGG